MPLTAKRFSLVLNMESRKSDRPTVDLKQWYAKLDTEIFSQRNSPDYSVPVTLYIPARQPVLYERKRGKSFCTVVKTQRGVKGAASLCAFAAVLYLLCKQLLQAAASFVMNLLVEGSSLNEPTPDFRR